MLKKLKAGDVAFGYTYSGGILWIALEDSKTIHEGVNCLSMDSKGNLWVAKDDLNKRRAHDFNRHDYKGNIKSNLMAFYKAVKDMK